MLGQTNVLEAGASENKGDDARLESFVGAIAIGKTTLETSVVLKW